MALLRTSIRIALRQTAPAARFFSCIARGSPGCSNAASVLRQTAPSARFYSSVARGSPGCTSTLRRPALTSSFFGNGGGGSSGFRTEDNITCFYVYS
ncbi:hypothetical protein ZWY2020_018653 [Hordeum vulgare]|nr:hypothetical protein ZWY2020_018653 [Hordeum vulgare]